MVVDVVVDGCLDLSSLKVEKKMISAANWYVDADAAVALLCLYPVQPQSK